MHVVDRCADVMCSTGYYLCFFFQVNVPRSPMDLPSSHTFFNVCYLSRMDPCCFYSC